MLITGRHLTINKKGETHPLDYDPKWLGEIAVINGLTQKPTIAVSPEHYQAVCETLQEEKFDPNLADNICVVLKQYQLALSFDNLKPLFDTLKLASEYVEYGYDLKPGDDLKGFTLFGNVANKTFDNDFLAYMVVKGTQFPPLFEKLLAMYIELTSEINISSGDKHFRTLIIRFGTYTLAKQLVDNEHVPIEEVASKSNGRLLARLFIAFGIVSEADYVDPYDSFTKYLKFLHT